MRSPLPRRRKPLHALTLACLLALTATLRLPAAITLTNLHAFNTADTATHGVTPAAAPILARDGNFYGTTREGGAFIARDEFQRGFGTIYRLTPEGVLTTLHSFDGDDGGYPSSLLQAADGNFYGVSAAGGYSFFRMTPDGTVTLLHAFNGDSIPLPSTKLILGPDGNFYGITSGLRDYKGYGTIFRLTMDGTFTRVCTFDGPDDLSAYSYNNLLLASDGNFYVTSVAGGLGYGTLNRITPGGVLTVLHAFQAVEGGPSQAGVIQGQDGALYGTTDGAGASPYARGSGQNFVYRVTLDGVYATLHVFTHAYRNGGTPLTNPLTQGRDGTLYGTTTGVGEDDTDGFTTNNGTVFRLSPDGSGFATLRVFSGTTDGTAPVGSLIALGDGSLVGATAGSDGFTPAVGSVFRLDLNAPATPPVVTATVVRINKLVYSGYSEFEADNLNIGVMFTLNSAPAKKLRVFCKIKGSARPGVDYYAVSRKLRFAPGQTSVFVAIHARPGGQAGESKRVVKIKLLPGKGYAVGTTVPVKDELTVYY